MKIIRLEASNVKRLTAVAIEPSGAVVEIAGDNGQGKTSVLDAIWWALGGEDAIQAKPVRRGASEAKVVLTLGNGGTKYVVTRKWDEAGTTSLKVADASGAKIAKPQTLLDGLVGALTFDPFEFSRMKPGERVAVLKRLVDFDFEEVARLRQSAYDRRTETNRDVRRLQAQLDGMMAVPNDTPDEPIDTDELSEKIAAQAEAVSTYERAVAARQRLEDRLTTLAVHIKDLETQLKGKRNEVEDVTAALEKAGDPVRPPDADQLTDDLRVANATNGMVRIKRERAKVSDELGKLRKIVEKDTATIAIADRSVADAIANAKLPVKGLTLGDEDVMLNGLPFEQASDAERLRVGMALAMAANPELRIIRVRDGEKLDKKAFKVIAEVAAEDDFQIWIESVTPHGEAAIIMENGSVRE